MWDIKKNTSLEVINPEDEGRLYKFVLTRISGEPRTAMPHNYSRPNRKS
jgi:hypothetical protein